MKRELTPDLVQVAYRIKALREEIRALQDQENELKDKLAAAMEGAEEGTVGGVPLVRVITTEREIFDVKALKSSKSYGYIFAMFAKPSVSRSIRVGSTTPGGEG